MKNYRTLVGIHKGFTSSVVKIVAYMLFRGWEKQKHLVLAKMRTQDLRIKENWKCVNGNSEILIKTSYVRYRSGLELSRGVKPLIPHGKQTKNHWFYNRGLTTELSWLRAFYCKLQHLGTIKHVASTAGDF